MTREELSAYGSQGFASIDDAGISLEGRSVYRGKVRDVVDLGDRLLLITSDRISAFDRVLGLVPLKGEILNRLALYWLQQTADLVPNHLIRPVGGRAVLVKKATVLPVEVIVRGYLTGSAWRDYNAGRDISGIYPPPGMTENQAFSAPIITPSTKAEQGDHDQPISSPEILRRGLVKPEIWSQVQSAALRLFAFGQEQAAKRGLILVDTKYEFGLDDQGELILVDEIHTPDSSRYWFADQPGRSMDKEFLRRWLMDQGFTGSGDPPEIPPEIILELSQRYIHTYETITGEKFSPISPSLEADHQAILDILGAEQV
jgi:phosphoribosylaminoimidazole-succinocarboxamide synthase